jgi:arginase family enzyme
VRLASHRTGERIAARERVVHADVVETTPDVHPPDCQYVISE